MAARTGCCDTNRTCYGTSPRADFDGDGKEELYILTADTFSGTKTHADRLFDHDPTTGLWHDLFLHAVNKPSRNLNSGRSVAVIDRRGTGRYGFFVSNFARPFRYYELNSSGAIVDLAPSLELNFATGGRGLWVGPLVSDRPDILCVNEQGANLLLRNTGMGSFLEIAGDVRLHDAEENGRGVAAFDADGDGRLDVAWVNWEGPHRMMIRQPDGLFRDRATPAFALPSAARNLVVADFDNDGYEEIFIHNLAEPNRLYRQVNGEWRVMDAGAATLPAGHGTGAAVADIDRDGRLELLLAHGESAEQPLALFAANGPDHNWLRVEPKTRFGAPARNALVRLTAAGRTQVRVIDGGSGYLCQMEPVAHFGLGTTQQVEQVRITWPDGASATLDGPAIRKTHRVPYPR
jgi:hypothetical protein